MIRRCLYCFCLYLLTVAGYSNLSATQDHNTTDVDIAKLVLENGLQACIIFDPDMEESMAALSVEAGAWDDPKEFSGMAHFVEHLVFLGSKTYPKEEEFLEYIHQRGGRCNASTLKDRTTYGFSLNTVGLQGALDRFAHFFIDPLFSEEVIQRELNAVHHEFEDGRENDLVRIWKVFKHTGNPYHPNRNFSCGNLLSLSKAKRADIVSWVKHHYGPSKMRLVVASSLPTEKVAEWIEFSFGQIPCDIQIKERKDHVAITSDFQRGSFFHIPPVLNNRHLSLVWEIPSSFLHRHNMQGLLLLEKELSKIHVGSLARILQEEGFSTHVQAEFWKMGQEQGVFCLHVKLTQQGLKEYKKVVEQCFQSIGRLSHKKKKEQFFTPIKSSLFKWKKLQDFQDAMHLARDLIDIPLDEYLSDDEVSHSNTIQIMDDFLKQMTPQRCIYFLVAPLDLCGIVPTQIEKWLGIEYCRRVVEPSFIEKWEKTLAEPQAQVQTKEIVPKNKQEIGEEDRGIKEPVFIVNTPTTRIRLVEPSLQSKKLELFFFIDTPFVSKTIRNSAFSEIFVRAINSTWEEMFSRENEIACELAIDMGRLCFVSNLSKEKALTELPKVFAFLRHPKISLEVFEKSKRDFLDHYEGDPDPIEHAHKILESLTTQFYSTQMQLYHTISKITYEEYLSWQAVLFNRLSLEGAVLGTIDQKEAKEIWRSIEEVFPFIGYKSYEVAPKGAPYLEERVSHYWTQRTHRLGNALLFLISSRGEHAKNRVIHQIVSAFLQTEFFTELRTKQQTSYRLYSWTRVINNAICYGFSLQSSTHHPILLLKRMENFVDDLARQAKDKFSEQQFEVLRHSIFLHWEKMKNQAVKKEDRFFAEKNLEDLMKISYEAVLRNIEETFQSINRKRLAILIEGRDFPVTDREEISSMGYEPFHG